MQITSANQSKFLKALLSLLCVISFLLTAHSTVHSAATEAQPRVARIDRSQSVESILGQLTHFVPREPYQLLFWGENHSHVFARSMFIRLLSKTQWAPELKKCLFVETSPEFQPAFDLLSLDLDLAKTTFRKIFQEKEKLFIEHIGRESMGDWIDLDDLHAATLSGFRVLAIDRDSTVEVMRHEGFALRMYEREERSNEDVVNFFRVFIAERNQIMADKIKTLFQDKTCERAVFPAGSAHLFLSAELPGLSLKTIPDLIPFTKQKVNILECDGSPESCKIHTGADFNVFFQQQ